MCASCGCGQGNEQHGDHRHITLHDLDQAAQAAHTTRAQVAQNIVRAANQAGPMEQDQQNWTTSSSQARTSGKKPGEYAPPLGQDSGTAWQESQQMGNTGRGGTENPLRNP